MTTYVLEPEHAVTSGARVVPLGLEHNTSSNARVVVGIPTSQLYYWSRAWQQDEATSVAEIESGQGVEFDSASDMIRWLMSDD